MLLNDKELHGRGDERATARAQVAEAEYPHWFDFSGAEKVLGDKAKLPPGGVTGWNHFAPSFVYQYRKLDASVTTRELVEVLAQCTRNALAWSQGGQPA